MFPIAGALPAWLAARKDSQQSQAGRRVSPFTHAYGRPMFEFFKVNNGHKEAFDLFMAGRRKNVRQDWFEVFPMAQRIQSEPAVKQSNDVFIVDVGGGKGHDLLDLRKRLPDAAGRFVLQDLPSMVSFNVVCRELALNSLVFTHRALH